MVSHTANGELGRGETSATSFLGLRSTPSCCFLWFEGNAEADGDLGSDPSSEPGSARGRWSQGRIPAWAGTLNRIWERFGGDCALNPPRSRAWAELSLLLAEEQPQFSPKPNGTAGSHPSLPSLPQPSPAMQHRNYCSEPVLEDARW